MKAFQGTTMLLTLLGSSAVLAHRPVTSPTRKPGTSAYDSAAGLDMSRPMECTDPPKLPGSRTWTPFASKRWPDNNINYKFEESGWTDHLKDFVKESLQVVEDGSCLTFTDQTDNAAYNQYYLKVTTLPDGCWSYIGMINSQNGYQQLNIQKSYNGGGHCMWKSTVIHEFLHALGTHHEQVRVDRDDYVTINVDNIWPNTLGNFEKYDGSITFGTCYDYFSVMHYDLDAFAIDNTQLTIIPKDPRITSAGKVYHETWAESDSFELNAAYDCPGRNTVPPPCEFYPLVPVGNSVTFTEDGCRMLTTPYSEDLSVIDSGVYDWSFSLSQDTCRFANITVEYDEDDTLIPDNGDDCKSSWLKVWDVKGRVPDGMASSKMCGVSDIDPMTFQATFEPVKVYLRLKEDEAAKVWATVCAVGCQAAQ